MNRRKSLKILTLGAISAGILAEACESKSSISMTSGAMNDHGDMKDMHHDTGGYKLSEYDQGLNRIKFFSEYEMKQLDLITELIIPSDEHSPGAREAKIPAFLEFMVKDQTDLQIPLRGGLRWLDLFSEKKVAKSFLASSEPEQKMILDQIAYPKKAKKELMQGVHFFSLLRNLTASGYFSSQIGVKDLGYIGNVANIWDGPPKEVLQKLGLEYDPKLLPLYVRPEDHGLPMIFA